MFRHGPPTWPLAPFSSPASRPTNTHSPMMHARSSPLQQTSIAPKTMPTQRVASAWNSVNLFSQPSREFPSQMFPGPSTSQRIHSTPLTAPLPTFQLHSQSIYSTTAKLMQHMPPLPQSPQFLKDSPRPAWMDASSSPMQPTSPLLSSPFQQPAYLTRTPPKSASLKGPLNAGRLHPLRKTAPVSHEPNASQCKPISAPNKRPALVSAYGTDDDERWTTLPSKKPKNLPSVDRRATFKLPGLSGAPGQKSGISASSSSRVIKFLPPPRDTSKNSSLEPISQHQPLSPTIDSSDVPKVIMYSPAKETPLRTPYRPLSPPTSDSPPQTAQDAVHVDLARIGSRYRPTREWIRQR
ncbi:hypothetical protein CPB85DRAFT_163592 [Mucidula mucida]|nr:hypothetical protein CPB85DRAFT_163592 [Mucidula mucida]